MTVSSPDTVAMSTTLCSASVSGSASHASAGEERDAEGRRRAPMRPLPLEAIHALFTLLAS
eukprot:scaffold128358_cov14-Tisochrysis_lutea.AAC.1